LFPKTDESRDLLTNDELSKVTTLWNVYIDIRLNERDLFQMRCKKGGFQHPFFNFFLVQLDNTLFYFLALKNIISKTRGMSFENMVSASRIVTPSFTTMLILFSTLIVFPL